MRQDALDLNLADPLSELTRKERRGLLAARPCDLIIYVSTRCGGARRILGAVTEPHAVRRLLAALGLAAEPPPWSAPAA